MLFIKDYLLKCKHDLRLTCACLVDLEIGFDKYIEKIIRSWEKLTNTTTQNNINRLKIW